MSDPAYGRAWVSLHGAVRMERIAEELWLVPVAVFAIGIVGFELVPNTLDWRGPLWLTFLGLLAAAAGIRVLADVRLKNFLCPRCRKPFVQLSIFQRAPLSTVERRLPCQHCKLPVGAVSGEVDRASSDEA